MVGWHYRLNGHEFEKVLGDGKGQGNLAFCSPWGHKESKIIEQLNNNNNKSKYCQKQPEREIFQGKKTGMCWGN